MFLSHPTKNLLAGFALAGVLTSPLHAAGPVPRKPAAQEASAPSQSIVSNLQQKKPILDVALQNDSLIGQFVDANGQPLGLHQFYVASKDQTKVLRGQTDQNGRFRVPIEKAGVYAIACEGVSITVRAWRPTMAPPKAQDGVLCVLDATARGQGGFMAGVGNRITPLLKNPIYIGAAVAAAIAIPVTLEAMDDDEEDGS